MATHSRILAWEVPWTEEPVGRARPGVQHCSLEILFLPHHVARGILVPGPGIKLEPPTLAMWHLNHRATRKSLTEDVLQGECSLTITSMWWWSRAVSPTHHCLLTVRVNADTTEQQETLSVTKTTSLTLKSL